MPPEKTNYAQKSAELLGRIDTHLQSIDSKMSTLGERLVSVEGKQIGMDSTLTFIRNDYLKIFFALLGIIGASIGLKFIGSPLIVIVANYLSTFAAVFVLASTFYFWKGMMMIRRLINLSFVSFVLYSSIMRGHIFEPGESLPPMWYSPVIDCFLILICVLLILREITARYSKVKPPS